MDNEEPIVWHEPILDEYWHRIEEAIDRKKHVTDIRGIHIQNVELKNFRLAMLVDICHRGGATNSSTMFNFNNANLCADGIMCLSKLIEISLELREFRLHHNRIESMDSASCLSRSLKSHTGITHLDLSCCDLGSSPEILSVILQSDVKYINLYNNNIDSLGAVKIAEYLEGDPPIQFINLDRNRMNDDDAILISQALKRNTNLKTIYLCSNNLTSVGVKALLTCAFDRSSLNAISESNHTLERLVLFSCQTNVSLVDSIDRMLGLNRMQKIVLALNGKDSLLKYLTNVPVELIPEVFAFPHGRQPVYLDLVYSTMRWWNMPLLYSYHHCVKSDTKRKREMTV
jgi:Ran GTPase-activating protein (RanGAP) involved in mRNA processing and transport